MIIVKFMFMYVAVLIFEILLEVFLETLLGKKDGSTATSLIWSAIIAVIFMKAMGWI